MVIINPQVRFDRTTTAQNKEIIRIIRNIQSDLKMKIKTLDIIATFLNHNDTAQKGVDMLITEINEELISEIKN